MNKKESQRCVKCGYPLAAPTPQYAPTVKLASSTESKPSSDQSPDAIKDREASGAISLKKTRIRPNNVELNEFAEDTMVLDALGSADTMVLECINISRAYLVRSDTSEEIPITKARFLIGRSMTNADYCIVDRIAVSRAHAAILFQNDRYYIVDLDSNNKTFLNDAELIPNQIEEMASGSRVRLADLELMFYAE
jgi:hypothetical protein